ncbi:chitinase CLP-like [Rutidosis leptorrhynchoides]|uniref:chitinase CLP-like n=1 Tax=Rutidosis leptorrhynchoides TaxID=125765 RepID=UPI003A992AF5
MISFIKLTLFILAFISQHLITTAKYKYPFTSAVAQVYKHTDAVKPLYSVDVMTAYVNTEYKHAKLLIDINAPFTWHDCIVKSPRDQCPSNKLCAYPVGCDEYPCDDVRTTYSYKNPSCSQATPNPILPGWGQCTCPVNVVNPVTGSCDQAVLEFDSFTFNTSNGRNTIYGDYGFNPNGRNTVNGQYGVNPSAACAPSSSFQSFPKDVSGVMAFSISKHALPTYLSTPLKNILSLCLPSMLSSPGVLFYGIGPYYFFPQSNVDVRRYLSYTPLQKHPDSFGYFIGVNSIVIKKRSINITANTITKISTIDPYTTLRTDIYNQVVRRFAKVTKRIPTATPIAPFGLCYKASSNDTKVNIKVPNIDFGLQDGVTWTITTANSMKQMTKDVACLAFVDGGATSEPAIVIGAFQFEDNFVMFNLENSTFGFSSSLLSKKTSCSNFNFTNI